MKIISTTFAMHLLFIAFAAVASTSIAAEIPVPKKVAANPAPFWLPEGERPDPTPPTRANIPYGTHEKQVMDFWKAASSSPTPLVFFIHGGSWKSNDKNKVTGVKEYLAAGISVISINYRFVQDATAAGIKPPVKWPLDDAARALQFVRSRAAGFNIDKTRIGASGGSAGACSSLWLAFHDDMADPKSSDPISRESTRLSCAGVFGAQTSLDPKQMKEWTPNSTYGGHAFGLNGDKARKISSFQDFLQNRDRILPWIKEYSPYELATADDPPVFMHYTVVPEIGKIQKDPTHTSNFGLKLHEKLKSIPVESYLMYPGAIGVPYPDPIQFLISKLRTAKP
jgi:acetyl esterase/lipase